MSRAERRAVHRAAEHLHESGAWPERTTLRGAPAYRASLLDLAFRAHVLAQARARRRWYAEAAELVDAACHDVDIMSKGGRRVSVHAGSLSLRRSR